MLVSSSSSVCSWGYQPVTGLLINVIVGQLFASLNGCVRFALSSSKLRFVAVVLLFVCWYTFFFSQIWRNDTMLVAECMRGHLTLRSKSSKHSCAVYIALPLKTLGTPTLLHLLKYFILKFCMVVSSWCQLDVTYCFSEVHFSEMLTGYVSKYATWLFYEKHLVFWRKIKYLISIPIRVKSLMTADKALDFVIALPQQFDDLEIICL